MSEHKSKLIMQLRNIIARNVGDYLWLMPEEAAILLKALLQLDEDEQCETLDDLLKE